MKNIAPSLVLALFLVLLSPPSRAETGAVDVKDGSRVVYDETGSGDPTLVFIHCWSCNRGYWKNQVGEFSKDHRIVAIDLPGHGESSAGKKLKKTIPGLALDVAQVLDRLGVENAVLVGSSMGGPIAMEIARLRPKRVRGIVGVDNLHDVEHPYPREVFEKIAAEMEADYVRALRAFVPRMFAPQADPKVVSWTAEQAATSCKPEVCVPLFRSLPDGDHKKMMSRAKVPIRNVNALPYNPDSPRTNVEANRKYGDFDAVEIGGAGHFLMLEKPEAFNEALKRQVSEIMRSSSRSR